PSSYWARAQVKALNKDMEGAEQAYKDAIAIEPKVESSHKLLILFALSNHDQKLYDEALNQAKKDIPGFVFSMND
ncbi:hypothetical protein IT400_01660, partial [Candidatus Nomurabacteria bacterium]|nr:hypothetical protein [Candidatus Nomurabacteria bacterium]